jgi:predicted RNase H-like nuclease (RuvC/YqgF family)
MGWIADLLKEIPSAARYKSELEAMEKESARLSQENALLKQKVTSLKSGNENLRQEIQRRDNVIQKEKSHDNLPDEQMQVLTLIGISPSSREDKIFEVITRKPESIRYDLEELKEIGFIESTSIAEFTFFTLTQNGRRYLKKWGVI